MINLTEKAKIQLKMLMKNENKPGVFFRVGVKEGCCEDMAYDYKLDSQLNLGDQVFEAGDVKIICDAKSLPFLDGMAVDYTNDCSKDGKEHFKFINPNAKGSCECGASFSA